MSEPPPPPHRAFADKRRDVVELLCECDCHHEHCCGQYCCGPDCCSCEICCEICEYWPVQQDLP